MKRGDSAELTPDSLAGTLFAMVPESVAAFHSFVEHEVDQDFSWDDVDFSPYQFMMEVFTAQIFVPEVRKLPQVSDLLERCARFLELMLASPDALVLDVAWFDVLEPLLDDRALVTSFYRVSAGETRRQVERLARANGIPLEPM